jgi:hypothetical protein
MFTNKVMGKSFFPIFFFLIFNNRLLSSHYDDAPQLTKRQKAIKSEEEIKKSCDRIRSLNIREKIIKDRIICMMGTAKTDDNQTFSIQAEYIPEIEDMSPYLEIILQDKYIPYLEKLQNSLQAKVEKELEDIKAKESELKEWRDQQEKESKLRATPLMPNKIGGDARIVMRTEEFQMIKTNFNDFVAKQRAKHQLTETSNIQEDPKLKILFLEMYKQYINIEKNHLIIQESLQMFDNNINNIYTGDCRKIQLIYNYLNNLILINIIGFLLTFFFIYKLNKKKQAPIEEKVLQRNDESMENKDNDEKKNSTDDNNTPTAMEKNSHISRNDKKLLKENYLSLENNFKKNIFYSDIWQEQCTMEKTQPGNKYSMDILLKAPLNGILNLNN